MWRKRGPIRRTLAISLLATCLLTAVADGSYHFVRRWHVGGRDDIPAPDGVAIDPGRGVVYVSDFDGGIVQRFTTAGRLLGSFGSDGRRPGQLDGPAQPAVDPLTGNVYVPEEALSTRVGVTYRVSEFSPSGRFIRTFGGPRMFDNPEAVAIDPASGVVYVADINRVLAFDRRGRLLRVAVPSSQVYFPVGVAVDPSTGLLLVMAHDGSGWFTGRDRRVAPLKRPAEQYLGPGAIDPLTGNALVVNACDSCADANLVWIYSPAGRRLGSFSRPGSHGYSFTNGQDHFPSDSYNAIAADCSDVFVTDDQHDHAEHFRRGGRNRCPQLVLASVRAEKRTGRLEVRVICVGPPGSRPCRGSIALGPARRRYRLPANKGVTAIAVSSPAARGAHVEVLAREDGVSRPQIKRDVIVS